MVVILLQKQRIQNALVELGRNGAYPPVTYDPDTGEAAADTDQSIAPETCLANETSARFGPAAHLRRRQAREIKNWNFALDMAWNQEVTLEPFLEQISDEPPILPRDDANDLKQVTLNLLGGEFIHPAQQQPNRGTRAKITFEAEIQPK